MIRSALLTVRMHRVEVAIAVTLIGLTAVSAVVVQSHVVAAAVPATCWMEHWQHFTQDPTLVKTPGCETRVEAFWSVADEAGFVASPLAVTLPFIIGLLLGVPVVGGELELRTAALAWSLNGDRRRWLWSRLLPMLLLTLGGLTLAAWSVAELQRTAQPWNYLGPGRIPNLTELGSEGATLVGRGLMTLGFGLLAGAVLGRTLTAFAVGAILSFALLFVGAPLLQAVLGSQLAVWRELPAGEDIPSLAEYRRGFLDSDGRFVPADPSSDVCTDCSVTASPQGTGAEPTRVKLMVPLEAYGTFEATETAVTSGIGILTILLTFPIVVRRRPS